MFALSSSQEIVWLHEQMLPGSRAYNFTAALDLWGPLDTDALRAGLAAVLAHHPGLRLELVARPEGLPLQRVGARTEPRLRTSDFSVEPDPEASFRTLLAAEAEEPLDTAQAPLLRWHLVRLADDHHRLIHVEHHLIHDGHSFAILLRDLFTVYRAHVLGEVAALPAAPSYEDHVRAAGPSQDAARERGLAYWKSELADAPVDLALPGLARPGVVRRHRGGQLRQSIGADLAERLRERGRRDGHTPFSTLLALFAELLRRHSGHRELMVGTAVGNRPPGFEGTVGMFVNTVPLRLRLDPVAPGTETVDEVTDVLFRALPHQDVPVQELTRALGRHTSGADNPLFSVMFSAHDAPLPDVQAPGLEVSLYEGFNTGTTRFDLDLVLLPDDRRVVGEKLGTAGMTLVWDYDADLFAEETAVLLTERLLALLRDYLDRPDAPLADLAPVTGATAATVGTGVTAATDGTGSAAPTPPAGLDRLADLDPAAAHDPGALALLAGTERLGYGDLDRRVGALVERLRAAGVTPGQPVATVLPRGVDSVVALLACLRYGAVYAPLSAEDPQARLALLLERLGPALVLATRQSALALPGTVAPALLDGPPFPKAEPAAVLDGAAYVIHTSGSTGVPKPVLVGRTALARYTAAVAARYGLGPADRVLLFARPSFDVALEEVLPSLVAGAALVVPQREVPTGPELVAVLAARGVTVANLPTSYALAVRDDLREALADGRWSPRLLVLGGERLPARALRGLTAGTGVTVLNAYGVTEATVTSTVHEITDEDLAESGRPATDPAATDLTATDPAAAGVAADAAEIPLGTELPGVRVHVLDEGLRPLPPGAVGELVVGGDALADGYLGLPEVTEARFVTVPALGGERVYRTGDRGFRGLDGRLRFLGRHDNQVKLRGFRIELEEIEAAASAELGGRSCAVVLHEDATAGPRLLGFLEGAEQPDQTALHAALARRLPAGLVPSAWTALAVMPLLPGGKPDRAALARIAAVAPGAAEAAAAEPQAFTDPGEAMVAEAWREVLGHDRFTADSHFFEVGGHSLLAARLAAWLEPRLGSRPPLRTLFQHPVLADQARALTGADQ
ncbi:non-ribosomal peptide synthetase [Streptomyces sp. BE303]|uniref:non-ribosomal peptide synthetase n=1 Tax=Streptomyces sp. BE303 TaxID=3002528 RepID=UPI002E7A2626|nr:amino acid adenylation domain-containing protein [Streptomyces sp. BE303]MED7952631.1 amino acid adenylation domain-containing protein [Streptomyces sp. BE303]